MALPEQIRKQSEAVQELYKQMNGEQPPEGETPPEDVTPPADDSAQPPAEADAPETSAPPPVVEQQPEGSKPPEETVLQKYKTLQGMYNAEVPRLHQQNRELNSRLQQMEQLLASMQSAQPQKPAEQAPKLISEKDVEEYGESLDVMRKVSREEINPIFQRLSAIEGALQQLQSSVVPQVQQVAHRQAVSAEQMFWSELSGSVSNWREINDSPDFQSWLLQPDPLTGITRQTYLEDAQRALDAQRVANFFRTWLDNTGQGKVAQSTGRASAASSELERQVAPGRSKNTGNPSQTKGKTWTPTEIQTFFNEVRQGKFKGKEAERDRIERDIFAAQREGRIQANA